MPRVFAYCRVSTAEQVPRNQAAEIRAAGFAVEPCRLVEETVSGSVPAAERPGFARLLDRLEPGDVLVVSKLDRLGRNAMDVLATVERLAGMGCGCIAWRWAGRMTMQVIAAVAEFERDLLIERTRAGLARARNAGKRCGRPPSLSAKARAQVLERLAAGAGVAETARAFKTTRQAILRVRAAAQAARKE